MMSESGMSASGNCCHANNYPHHFRCVTPDTHTYQGWSAKNPPKIVRCATSFVNLIFLISHTMQITHGVGCTLGLNKRKLEMYVLGQPKKGRLRISLPLHNVSQYYCSLYNTSPLYICYTSLRHPVC